MPLELSCPYCAKAMKLADSTAGLVVICPRCKNRLKVGAGQPEHSGHEEGFQVVEDSSCPCCHSPFAIGATVCGKCGYDLETRQRPMIQPRTGDEVQIVGSQFLGTYTEFLFRRDPFEGYVLFVDTREASLSTGYSKLVLSEFRQALINHFQISEDSGSMNLDLIDQAGDLHRVYAGDSSPMEWLIERFQLAGLEVKRV